MKKAPLSPRLARLYAPLRAVPSARIGQILLLLGGGALAGALAARASLPLPWMLGPMLPVALATILLGLRPIPNHLRCLGQMLMGAAVGLYLTPSAVERILAFAGPILFGSLLMVLAACLISLVQLWLTRTDPATAIFANIPGGPMDMALMAAEHGGDPARVAAFQTVRIASVVLIFPPLMMALSPEIFPAERMQGTLLGSLPLAGLGLAAAALARRLRLLNPYFVGPLLASGALTGAGLELPPFHPALVPAGQVCVGVALGGMFQRQTFRGAGSFTLSLVLTTAGLLLASVAVSALQERLFEAEFATMVLAHAPAAIAEMVITAQVLHLDVPLVAAFQLARILLGLMLGSLFFRAYTALRPGPGQGR